MNEITQYLQAEQHILSLQPCITHPNHTFEPYNLIKASLKSPLSGKGLLKCHGQLTIYPLNNLIRRYGRNGATIPAAEINSQ